MSEIDTPTYLGPSRVTRTCLFTEPTAGIADDPRERGDLPRRHEVPVTPDAAAYKQAGNAVCTGAVQVAYSMLPVLQAEVEVVTEPPQTPAPLRLAVPPT